VRKQEPCGGRCARRGLTPSPRVTATELPPRGRPSRDSPGCLTRGGQYCSGIGHVGWGSLDAPCRGGCRARSRRAIAARRAVRRLTGSSPCCGGCSTSGCRSRRRGDRGADRVRLPRLRRPGSSVSARPAPRRRCSWRSVPAASRSVRPAAADACAHPRNDDLKLRERHADIRRRIRSLIGGVVKWKMRSRYAVLAPRNSRWRAGRVLILGRGFEALATQPIDHVEDAYEDCDDDEASDGPVRWNEQTDHRVATRNSST
jgi:hypothetical protein